jgi:hypothetical protein
MIKDILFFFLVLTVSASANIQAGCDIIDGNKKTPFNGKELKDLAIEKKSLVFLNDEFPNLHIIELAFKGEILTCSICSEKHISCTE